ncbi:unnamed protein product [Didymodactylos carnosus]|uniref:F-box domain-containing protein n=1 Tax=Didymodactylos carnosus TaxID=1234261 RepID=A0A815QDV0_9BILA|nr:unnamed protein product [Didymodactylos carnosus]CAF1461980.1 unnamed protein product [Didymodactylos carnosus]CAF3749224.1 unnamed protein product [Didymodactylos carnosus]CAF4332029.1 unnamed protein product [Didymodactylos carnosus]
MTSSSCITSVLPSELIQQIFFYIAFDDLLSTISLTCRHFHRLLCNRWFIKRYFSFENRKKTLLNWWKFDNDKKIGLDSVNETTSSSFSRSTIVNGTPRIKQCDNFINDNDGKKANCLLLDGQSWLYKDGGSTMGNIHKTYSITLWFLNEALIPRPSHTILTLGNRYCGWFFFYITSSENKLKLKINQNNMPSQYFASDAYIEPRTWYLLSIVVNAEHNTLKVYVDGHCSITIYQNKKEKEPMPSIWIGGQENRWVGQIADVTVWSRVLSKIEIRAIYDQRTSTDNVNIAEVYLKKMKQ